MAWSRSGTTITQTGTNGNLNGLRNMPGVTIVTSGVYGTEPYHRTYFLNNRALRVNGTLSFNPKNETLVFHHNCPRINVTTSSPNAAVVAGHLIINGTLTIGRVEGGTVGNELYSTGYAIITNAQSTQGWHYNVAAIVKATNGRLTINGGIIRAPANIAISGGNCTINKLRFEGLPSAGAGQLSRIGYFNNTQAQANSCVINDIDCRGQFIEARDGSFFPQVNSANVEEGQGFLVFADSTISNITSHPDNNRILFTWQFGNNVRVLVDVFNNKLGTAQETATAVPTSPYVNYLVRINQYQEIRHVVTDSSGASIVDCAVYARDYDHGNRMIAVGVNTSADNIYYDRTTGAGIANQDILLRHSYSWINAAGTAQETNQQDYRQKSGDGTNDLFDFYYLSYSHLLASSVKTLRGLGRIELGQSLLADNLVTDTQANVAAYTDITDLNQLYDACKYVKVINQAGIEFISPLTLIATANGTTLDFGTLDVVLDDTLPGYPVQVTGGNEITINASTLATTAKFNKLLTTGTITLGTTIYSGLYEDSTGAYATIKLTGLQPGCDISVKQGGTMIERFDVQSHGSVIWISPPLSVAANPTVDINIIKAGYRPYALYNLLFPASGVEVPVSQQQDRVYT